MEVRSMYRNPQSGTQLAVAHADLLSAMSNAKRLMILNLLMSGEIGVGELSTSVGLSQSALSQHLAVLRSHKLVKTRRDQQKIYYSTASNDVAAILNVLRDIFGEPEHEPKAGDL
jgi:DNA-binding transcriptional ArsR family regulator